MACLMLVCFNKESKLQQQHNFILYSMCYNIEIMVVLYPGIFSPSALFSLLHPDSEFYLSGRAHQLKGGKGKPLGAIQNATHTPRSLPFSPKREQKYSLSGYYENQRLVPHLGGNGTNSWRRNRRKEYLIFSPITPRGLEDTKANICFSTFRGKAHLLGFSASSMTSLGHSH